MPDTDTVLIFIGQVFTEPLRIVFTFFGALGIGIYVIQKVAELVDPRE